MSGASLLAGLGSFDRTKLRKTSTTVRDVVGRVKIERSGLPTKPQVDARGDARAPPMPTQAQSATAHLPIRSTQRSRLAERKRTRVSQVVALVRRGAGIDELRSLVDTGANIHEREMGSRERMPIHWAASRVASLAVLRCLVDAGAFVGARDARGFTPLHIAALRGAASSAAEAMALLIAAHASPNSVTEDGRTPIRDVCVRGDGDAVASLLRCGAATGRRPGDGPIPAPLAFALNAGCAQARETRGSDADVGAWSAAERALASASASRAR
jgi:hypothetical protein